MFFKVLFFFILIQLDFCQDLVYLDESEIDGSPYFQFNTDDYWMKDEYIVYGLWSRYDSISIFAQKQTDYSSIYCHNLHNALEGNTKKSNFLYYDCLDLEQKSIKKIVQFVDAKNEQHNLTLDIDIYQYHNTWYYFGVSLWVIQNKFELWITQNLNILLHYNLDFMLPFFDKNLIIKFGGGLYLNENQRVSTFYQQQFFFPFPGQLCYFPIERLDNYNQSQQMHDFAIYSFNYLKYHCTNYQSNFEMSQISQIFQFVDQETKLYEDTICNSYSIDAWIKGINIHQSDKDFLYKFMQISANSEQKIMANDNLCSFQLLYRIQNDKLYLQILTYSYTFPTLNLDFSTNPFLIKKEFELDIKRLYQWHFLSVRLKENLLITQITFYENESKYQLNFHTLVRQFYNIRFKISVGNLFQNKNNYIDMKIFALTLISDWKIFQQKQCHKSCKTCDGPTKNDCLSCEQQSLRFYIPETQNCVCPEDLLDQEDGTCKSYENLQFTLVEEESSKPQCQYGYFKYDELTCGKCPSNPNTNTIFCLNCLQNPLTWKQNPICETMLKFNDSDTQTYIKVNEYDTFTFDSAKFLYYIYDFEVLKFCRNCDQQNVIDFEIIYNDYLQIFQTQDHLCSTSDMQQEKCQYCEQCQCYSLNGCEQCQIKLEQLVCIKCFSNFYLIDEKCIQPSSYSQKCVTPYYLNSLKNCQLCLIENCLYCFEYLTNDFSKNTLFKDYNIFMVDEFHQIGCALCQEGYQYNILTNKCMYEQPKILNCKRSFINLEGDEICTLADSQSFEIAPEIINCQWKIQNCYSCIKTPFQTIKCIVCEDKYVNNIFTGQCDECSIEHSVKCIQGENMLDDGWVQLVQGFIMQFLNKYYFYPNPESLMYAADYIISCENGYSQSAYFDSCLKYCNSDCLKCIELETEPFGFICVECPPNYYNQPSRSTDYRNCIVCPKLCSICEPRTLDEISSLNPYFIVTEDNLQFTHKCISQIQRIDVYIDSKTFIAKLILEDKKKILNFDVPLIQDNYSEGYISDDFVQQNSIDFCNQIGIGIIQITFNFEENSLIELDSKSFSLGNTIENTLKQKIFSLEQIIFNLIGQKQKLNRFFGNLITRSFDSINISEINFLMSNQNQFIFFHDFPIQLTIQNCSFQSEVTKTYGMFNINTTYSKSIQFYNLTFQNLYLIDSIIFDISGDYLLSEIFFIDIVLLNCEFINSSLVSIFHNQQDMKIQNLRIENCTFNNSILIDINKGNSSSQFGYLKNVQFFNNQFYNCDFIKINNFEQFIMTNVQISNNNFYNSALFVSSNNFLIDGLIVELNKYKSSFFFKSSNEFNKKQILCFFKNLELKDNQLFNSLLFSISPYYQLNQYELQVIIKELLIQNNYLDNSQQSESYLFYIHCNQVQINLIKILQLFSIQIFNIYDTFSILVQQLNFTNPYFSYQIPLGETCLNNFQQLQVIKIFGFNTIKLEDVYINSLSVQDSSILEIYSNLLFNTDQIEKIQMKNIFFEDNILLKQKIGKRMSMIYIYSEKIQTITLDSINFHQNLFHQSADDLSENIAGQIFISSQMSKITITNILSKQNGITNSSCSLLYFTASSLFISNYYIDGLNLFNGQLLQRYFSNTEIFKLYSKQEIQLIIQKLVSIQTKGSACYATVTQLEMKDSMFLNVLSQRSPLFEIKTEGQGIIKFENLIIRNIEVIYDSNLEFQGSISIYSLNSQLNLNFINIIFDQVFNKFSSSILYLTPSQKKNRIVFKNIQILNSLSLLNQIVKAEFSDLVKELNFVHIQNVTIIQTEQAWFSYFKKIGQINSQDLQKIINDNAMIYAVSCTLIIENLFVDGVILSPILKILNAVNLQITKCKFLSIQTFYAFNIIYIGQINFSSMKIMINQNEFQNLQLYQPNNQHLIEKLQLDKYGIDRNCQFDFTYLIFKKNIFTFEDIVRLIQSQKSSGSLIFLQSLSDKTQVLIQSLKISENNCDFCQEGLISINVEQIQKLKIKELICIKNQISKYGCLTVQSNKVYQNQFTVSNSIVALNSGQTGVGITIINLDGFIQKTIVFNNTAVNRVGGIDVKILDNSFKLENTKIFQNQAEQCGGIQIVNQSNVLIENFIQSLIILNKAQYLANNIVGIPTQLQLRINHQVMKHNLEKIGNITVSILEMPIQKVIQQNNVYFSNYLMLPSNQKILDYKIFDLQTLQYFPYITEFSLSFLNSQREQLGNFEELNCTVFQNIIQRNGAQINQSELYIISFDTKKNIIDLANLYLTFDPYEQSQYIQEIEIICNISENQALSYKFKSKSFYCQLGEFYTYGGCQICDYKFGFYSVSYNATKCSIFDKTKFSEITSNTLSLLPGFWRPNYLSDQTEFCYQKSKNCLGGWSVGDQSCLQGNLGGLCYECDFYNVRGDGYYFKNLDNDECSLCDDSNNYVMYFIIVSLIAMISIFMTLRSIEKTNLLFNNLKVGEKFGKIIFKLNQGYHLIIQLDHESFLIKMFVNYLWIFSLIFAYNINFSVNLTIVDQASNTSYSMANNLDCFVAQISEINLVYIRLIATIFFIFIQLILVYLIFYVISKLYKSKFDLSNISNTSLYLYISNNAALTKQFCSLIAKKSISNIDFVQGNMALRFDSITHQNWIFMFILPGLIINGCIIPILLIIILLKKRNQLDQIQIRKYFCYLFNEYHENNYYWEQIKIWQKTVLIIIMVYFEARVFLKTTLFGLTLIIYQYLANYYKPYIILSLNKLDYQAGLLCCIAIFLAAARNESNLSSSFEISNILQITIAFLCLLLIYMYSNIILKAYYKKYKLAALLFLLTITKKLSFLLGLTESLQKIILTEQKRRDRLYINFGKLKKYLVKIYRLNSQFRQDQTLKTDQTLNFFTNKSIKFQNRSQPKE